MNLLLKSIRVTQPGHSFNGKTADIFIKDGVIRKIAARVDARTAGKARVLDMKGKCVSAGWFDLRANFRDPGQETKEDLLSGLDAAASGGFTGVALMPSTDPVVQSKADIEYLLQKSSRHAVDVYPTGSLSVDGKGRELSEMFDMKQAGAVAFTDDKHPITDAGLMVRALQYASGIGALVMVFPDERSISGDNLVNESAGSVAFGMTGSPAVAEEVMVSRDLRLQNYAEGRIHFSTLSTAGAVDLVRKAKKQKHLVSADIAAHQLCFDDSALAGYDTNLKVLPPFRTRDDIKALVKGLEDGAIDAICSDHMPEDRESKEVEFEYARPGIAGIETAFAAAHTCLKGKLKLDRLVAKFTTGPRDILGLPHPDISEGAVANLTIFDPKEQWSPEPGSMVSRSGNTPFYGYRFTGRPLGIVNNNKTTL